MKVDEPRDSGHTPLSLAARDGYLDVIKWWIASGREMDLDVPLLEILRQNGAQVRHLAQSSGSSPCDVVFSSSLDPTAERTTKWCMDVSKLTKQ